MKKLFTLFVAALAAMSMFAQYDTWSVVGNHAIMNGAADWAIAATDNDLATEDGENYTLTVTGKTLEAGTAYEYKYAKDHAWATSIPQSGNLSLSVTETAVYTIVYSVNISTGVNSAVATKTGEAGEITHVYSVAGNNADLFGAEWSQTNTATEMTKGEDGIYTWTKENVVFTAGTIEFKVVVDHAWGEAYPVGSDNAVLTIDQAGTYDVVITFNASTKAVNATATPIITSYTIVGDAEIMGGAWKTDTVINEMEKVSDNVYRLTKEYTNLAAGTYEYKVVGNHSYSLFQFPQSGNQSVTVEDALFKTIVFTLTLGETTTLTATVSYRQYDYYMIGSSVLFGEAGTKMTDNGDGTYKLMVEKTLAAGNYLYNVEARVESNGQLENMNSSTEVLNAPKRVAQTPSSAQSFTLVEEREYTIRFDYNSETGVLSSTDESTGWPTALDNAAGVQIEKLVRDGQVVIIKNGVEYNVLGARL